MDEEGGSGLGNLAGLSKTLKSPVMMPIIGSLGGCIVVFIMMGIILAGFFLLFGGLGGTNTAIAGPDCLSPAGGSVTVLDENRLAEGFGKIIQYFRDNDTPPNSGAIKPEAGADFVKAGKQYGVNPFILIGEAIVESTMGRSVIICDDSTNTMNSFGRTASESQPRCYKTTRDKYGNDNSRFWYVYPSIQDSIYQQAQYVYNRYVDADGACTECADGPLSFSEYLEIYSPAFENNQTQMTKNYNFAVNWLQENGYGDSFTCGVGSSSSTTSTSTTSTTKANIPL